MTTVARRRSDIVSCVILAAGASSRLGEPKQLVRYRGWALLRHSVDAAAGASSRPPIVVVGAGALRLRALLRRSHPASLVVANAGWQEGIASSVRAGLRAAPDDVCAVLFLLTDQPLVDAWALRRLIAAWRTRPGRPAAARYGGRAGVPAVIPRHLFPALRRLRGDEGARRLLAGTADVTVVDLPRAGFDVDRPEHVARLKRRAV